MQSDPDYYAILQLPAGSSFELVREQHRRLAKVFHPDRNNGDEWCHEQTIRINTAFEYLSDPERKAAYDASWSRAKGLQAPSEVKAPRRTRKIAIPTPISVPLGMPYSEFYERPMPRPRWTTAGSWLVAALSIVILGSSLLHHETYGGGVRRMLLLPPLHTGLMGLLTGGGPKVIEHQYRAQYDVLCDSAESGLGDARDTLIELRAQDQYEEQHPDSIPTSDNLKRDTIERRLWSESTGLESNIKFAAQEINRFDWTTPGVRRRLPASNIDSDLGQIDDAIQPLHDTVCAAQQVLIDQDPFSSSQPISNSQTTGT